MKTFIYFVMKNTFYKLQGIYGIIFQMTIMIKLTESQTSPGMITVALIKINFINKQIQH